MEKSNKTSTQGNPTASGTDQDTALCNENLVESLRINNFTVEERQARFTSSVTINKFKTSNGDVSIIMKSKHDAAETPQHLYDTSLLYNTLKTAEGDMQIIIESSNPSSLNNPTSRVIFDSSDTLRLDIELARLRAEEKRLEAERMDAEFRKTDREGWIKKHEIEIKKLELERDIRSLEVKKLESIEPKEIQQCKFKVQNNLVKYGDRNLGNLNSENVSNKKYEFSADIFVNQDLDKSGSVATILSGETLEDEKIQSNTTNKAQKVQETLQALEQGEQEIIWESTVRHHNILDNLEPSYGLMAYLIKHGILNSEAQEDLQREGKTRYEQCNRLLSYINIASLEKFLSGLRKTVQSHLAAFMECKINKTARESDKEDDWPLDNAERKVINKLYVLLRREIATVEMVDALLVSDCISEEHKAYIEQHGTKYKRNEALLDIIRRRSKAAVKIFWTLVIEYSAHLKDIVNQFLVPGSKLTLIKVSAQDNLTEEQRQKIRDKVSVRDNDETLSAEVDKKQINFCVSGDEVFAIVPVDEPEVDTSSMIVSEEIRSAVEEALISCTGGDEVIVETLENVETLAENDKSKPDKASWMNMGKMSVDEYEEKRRDLFVRASRLNNQQSMEDDFKTEISQDTVKDEHDSSSSSWSSWKSAVNRIKTPKFVDTTKTTFVDNRKVIATSAATGATVGFVAATAAVFGAAVALTSGAIAAAATTAAYGSRQARSDTQDETEVDKMEGGKDETWERVSEDGSGVEGSVDLHRE